MTRRSFAKLGKNQKLVLVLSLNHPHCTKDLFEEFASCVNYLPMDACIIRHTRMVFEQAIRSLRSRDLIATSCSDIPHSGRADMMVAITPIGRAWIADRAKSVIENLLIREINLHLRAGRDQAPAEYFRRRLKNLGIEVSNVAIGRILAKYGRRLHYRNANAYFFKHTITKKKQASADSLNG